MYFKKYTDNLENIQIKGRGGVNLCVHSNTYNKHLNVATYGINVLWLHFLF